MPTGLQPGIPSLLDYGAASRGLISQIRAFWMPMPMDHAAILIQCDIKKHISCHFEKTTWKCDNDGHAIEWLRANLDNHDAEG